MTVQLLDIIGALPVEEHFHSAQLPVGDVADVFQIVKAHVADLIFVHQREGSDLLAAQTDKVLLVAGQTGGGLHIGQLGIAHLVLHISDIGVFPLIGGVLGSRGIVQRAPVGMGEQLGEDLLSLDGGLGQFKVGEPAVKPGQADKGAQEENQDEQEIQRVEDHAAQTGAGFLLLGYGRLRRRHGPLGGRLGTGGLPIGRTLTVYRALSARRPLTVRTLLSACGPLNGPLTASRTLGGRSGGLSVLLGSSGVLGGGGWLCRGGALDRRGLGRLRLGFACRGGLVDIVQPAQVHIQPQVQIIEGEGLFLGGGPGHIGVQIHVHIKIVLFLHTSHPLLRKLPEPSRSSASVSAGTAAESNC